MQIWRILNGARRNVKRSKSMMKRIDGLSAYDILKIEGCPITLPRARSMTQARLDYEGREDQIFEWYLNNKDKICPECNEKLIDDNCQGFCSASCLQESEG
jgi:hypothetical protein